MTEERPKLCEYAHICDYADDDCYEDDGIKKYCPHYRRLNETEKSSEIFSNGRRR